MTSAYQQKRHRLEEGMSSHVCTMTYMRYHMGIDTWIACQPHVGMYKDRRHERRRARTAQAVLTRRTVRQPNKSKARRPFHSLKQIDSPASAGVQKPGRDAMQVCRASGCGVPTYGKEEETSAGSAGEKDGGLPRLQEGYRSFWIINKACQYAVPKQDHHWLLSCLAT